MLYAFALTLSDASFLYSNDVQYWN